MSSPEQLPLYPVFSHAPPEASLGEQPLPPDETGSVIKELPAGALPEPPDNAPTSPSSLDRLDGYHSDDVDGWL